MRNYAIVLIIFLSFNTGSAQIENDKALHFAGGSLYGLAGAGIAKEISNGNRYWTFVGSVGGALLVGIGKEALDSRQEGNRWDNEDLLATTLGGFAVGFTIDIFTDKKKKKKNRTASIEYDDSLKLNFKNQLPTLNELQFSKLAFYTE